MPADRQGLLDSYRILDLTDENGFLGGKLLADLGAEVIKVEPPGGDRGRNLGPFYHDILHPERSLYWFALNAGKRGITLDIRTRDGQELFKRLAAAADAVLESFPPGFMDRLGLGYEDLRRIRPEIVYAAITPFGSSGPYRDYKASDLVLWALSGLLFICGDPDRPPVRISLPQSCLHAGVDAATGTALALYHRRNTGRGQRVEISIQKAMERVAYISRITWDGRKRLLRRPGSALRMPPRGTTTPVIWPCQDGYVAFYLFGGSMGAISNPALAGWMEEEGVGTEFIRRVDWPRLDIGRTPQEEMDQIVGPIAEFFLKHTKGELWEEGVKRRVMVYPVASARDVLGDRHLHERGFWVELEHSELNDVLRYPGAFVKTADGLCGPRRRSPLIGEHNAEILGGELGITRGEMEILKQNAII